MWSKRMSDKETLEKVKEYLELDIENSYAEQLLFWVKEWEKKE